MIKYVSVITFTSTKAFKSTVKLIQNINDVKKDVSQTTYIYLFPTGNNNKKRRY